MADAGVNDTGSCVVPICSTRSEDADRKALMVVAGCLRPEQGGLLQGERDVYRMPHVRSYAVPRCWVRTWLRAAQLCANVLPQ